MVNIKFIYGYKIFQMIVEDKPILIKNVLLKFTSIIFKDINDLYFYYKGKELSYKNNEKILNLKNLKNKDIIINVINLIKVKKNKKLNQIICPECKEMAILNYEEDNIIINKCINNHNNKYYIGDIFMKDQYINELKCDICNNDKYLYNDNFYLCSCNKYICPLCINNHNAHNMIKYNDRFYKCNIHNKNYIIYCNNCNKNLCEKCEEEHNKKHKKIFYKEKKPNEKKMIELIKEYEDIKLKINKYKYWIKILNNLYTKNMNNFINYLDEYILLYENIFSSIYNIKNYETIINLNNLKNKKIIKDIDLFLNDNINNKYKKLITILNKQNNNEMTIIYKNNNKKIKLFDELFIESNKDNCYLLIDGKISEICSEYEFNKKQENITIKLIECKMIEDMSYMFLNCKSLLSLDISKWNMNNIKYLYCMFLGCSSLHTISDISKFNIKNNKNTDLMFYDCKQLNNIPDILKLSKCNIKNIGNIKLNKMPIIYDNKKGNKDNKRVRIFGEEFVKNNKENVILLIDDNYCELEQFHIDKKNEKINIILIEKEYIKDISYMFYECRSLSSLTDISKWNMNNVNDMSCMF